MVVIHVVTRAVGKVAVATKDILHSRQEKDLPVAAVHPVIGEVREAALVTRDILRSPRKTDLPKERTIAQARLLNVQIAVKTTPVQEQIVGPVIMMIDGNTEKTGMTIIEEADLFAILLR